MTEIRKWIYEDYVELQEDCRGTLESISFKNTENFNFAYDVVDKLAEKDPDKIAMVHIAKNK